MCSTSRAKPLAWISRRHARAARHHGGLRDDRVGAGFDFRGEQRRRERRGAFELQSFEARIRRARESVVGLDLAGVSRSARGSQKRERVQVWFFFPRTPSPVTHRSADAPASAATRIIARASSTSRHHDAETVCTCVSGSAARLHRPETRDARSHERDERVGSVGGPPRPRPCRRASRALPSAADAAGAPRP